MRRLSAASRLPAALLLAGLFLVTGCQDPAGVGLGLIDEDAASPNLRTLAPTRIDTVRAALVTAGFADVPATDPSALYQPRVLVGNVQDAIYGNVRAVAYLDAVPPLSLPDGFGDRPVTRVTLELARDYVYGDTTASLPVELRQVTGTWNPRGLSSDTTLGTGEVLATATILASDTLGISIALPEAWVAANSALFASSAFTADFEGFALSVPAASAPSPGAVIGFNVTPGASATAVQSRLRVATARDTVTFRLSEVFTRIERDSPAPTAGRLLIQAGLPTGLQLSFDTASIGSVALARASVRLPLDRSLSGSSGTFLRPLATRAALFGVTATGSSQIAEIRVANTGDATTATSAFLTQVLQDVLLDRRTYLRYEVLLPSSPISLDVLPLALDATPGPRLSLTVVN